MVDTLEAEGRARDELGIFCGRYAPCSTARAGGREAGGGGQHAGSVDSWRVERGDGDCRSAVGSSHSLRWKRRAGAVDVGRNTRHTAVKQPGGLATWIAGRAAKLRYPIPPPKKWCGAGGVARGGGGKAEEGRKEGITGKVPRRNTGAREGLIANDQHHRIENVHGPRRGAGSACAIDRCARSVDEQAPGRLVNSSCGKAEFGIYSFSSVLGSINSGTKYFKDKIFESLSKVCSETRNEYFTPPVVGGRLEKLLMARYTAKVPACVYQLGFSGRGQQS
ncbi:hypothetical protein FB451DRAFT_1166966 [Mycena latifolia]|nr:hypothetical protein FB451DRAFT_1166966 [Mycena latifolia]